MEELIKESEPVPERPRKRKEIWLYLEKYKESILLDYSNLTLPEFFKRWGLTSTTWQKLKKKWAIAGRGRGRRHGNVVTPKQGENIELGEESTDSQGLNEHERYLILIGYRQAVQEFLGVDRV